MTATVRHLCCFCSRPCAPDTTEDVTDEMMRLCHGDPVSHGICEECFKKHFPEEPNDET